ncbi:MAG TPA: hypothetical protein P5562_00565 [Candidatus Woesebacteria bacterium]|nr:hypothetical protein [Candidatus Woesebacteria bacterium]
MLRKLAVLVLLIVLFLPISARAQSETDLQKQINEYQIQINKLTAEKNTLSNQIKIIDSQISLAQLKINQTENEINQLEADIQRLTGAIGDLDISLNQLTTVFIQEINQNYRLLNKVRLLVTFSLII